jgi:hypothetical protein
MTTPSADREIPPVIVQEQVAAAAAAGALLGDISADWATFTASFQYVWPDRSETVTAPLPP